MNIYIGQQKADGVIRYVTIFTYSNNNNYRITSILRTFYSRESRVTALINLGNLELVRPSPYGKWQGYGDPVHCRAEIRDDKKGKGSRQPRYGSEAEFLKLEGHLFLYKDDRWHYRYADGFSTTLPEKLPKLSTKPFEGLEFYNLDEKGGLSYCYGRDFKCWNDIVAMSNEEKTPVFIFRKNKLVATINHPINKSNGKRDIQSGS